MEPNILAALQTAEHGVVLKMDAKITYGIFGIVLLIAGFGGSMMLDQDTIDHTYVCSVNEKIGTFDHLSSTSKTGYWPDPLNASNELSKVCYKGEWIKLEVYAASLGIDPILFLQQNIDDQQIIDHGVAPSEECFPIDQNIGCVAR